MSKLIDLIRAQRRSRSGADDDDPFVIIRHIIAPRPSADKPLDAMAVNRPSPVMVGACARIGDIMLEKAPDEPLDVFEARAVAAVFEARAVAAAKARASKAS